MSLLKPRPLIPILIKPVIPAWVLIGAMAAQYAITTMGRPEDISCFLKLERIHHSTSVNEKNGKDAVKLNITSECSQEQIQTQLTSGIYSIRNGKEILIYNSNPTNQLANKNDRRKAYFLDFWVECKKGATEMYRGSAAGVVTLKDGKKLSVSGNTGKYLAVICESKAK
jgi:hypothetical protein